MTTYARLAVATFIAVATLALAPDAFAAVDEAGDSETTLYTRQIQSLQSEAVALKSGQYLWRDEGTDQGPVTMIVSVPLQRLYVFRNFELVGVSTVSTGKPGHSTPVGAFEILQKRVHHRSNIYSNAPMPFMQRLTWDGIALHAGHNPGVPASHGCIRLPMAFARLLFGATVIGTAVAVVQDDVIAPPPPEERFVPMLMAMPERLRSRDAERVFVRGEGSAVSLGTASVAQADRPSTPRPTTGTRALTMLVYDGSLDVPHAELRVPARF